MADARYVLPCEPQWEEGIYRIETADAALGYDPETDRDGVANIQALQLGNRTLWLKAQLEAGHTPDGGHALRDADFADAARIPEFCLALDCPTKELVESAHDNGAAMDRLRAEAGRGDDLDLSLAAELRALVTLAARYGEAGDFEVFSAGATLRDGAQTTLLKEIAGDDSLDVMDASAFRPGETYVLCDEDGGRPEWATVMSVLTGRRIRCVTALGVTRRAGRLGSTNLVIGPGFATARHETWYVSRVTDALKEAAAGKLVIRRDPAAVTATAFWLPEGGDWTRLEVVAAAVPVPPQTGPDDSPFPGQPAVDDVFRVPGGSGRLRVGYTAPAQPFRIHSLALVPDRLPWHPALMPPPAIRSAAWTDGVLTVRVTPYVSLYDVPLRALDIEYAAGGESRTWRLSAPAVAAGAPVSLPAGGKARARFVDEDGETSAWSPWSDPVASATPEGGR